MVANDQPPLALLRNTIHITRSLGWCFVRGGPLRRRDTRPPSALPEDLRVGSCEALLLLRAFAKEAKRGLVERGGEVVQGVVLLDEVAHVVHESEGPWRSIIRKCIADAAHDADLPLQTRRAEQGRHLGNVIRVRARPSLIGLDAADAQLHECGGNLPPAEDGGPVEVSVAELRSTDLPEPSQVTDHEHVHPLDVGRPEEDGAMAL